jgi:Na+/H+-dicarboxylate symporter
MLQRWFAITLWKRVLLGVVLGAAVGLTFGESAAVLKPIGDLFVRGIKMMVVPLIFTTLVAGVVSMGSAARLGSIGAKAITLYLCTTAVAITIGLLLGEAFNPGEGISFEGVEPNPVAAAPELVDRLLNIVPANPINALAEGDVLAIILFGLLFGSAILLAGEKGELMGRFFESASDVMLQLTHMVMEFAPIGVFALIAWVAGTKGVEAFVNIFTLIVAVYTGCLLHMLVTYGGLMAVQGLPLKRFFQGILDAQMVAYSTSSSSATLPMTLSCATDNLGVKRTVSSSVLPLGATINMDGTAMYLGILTIFAAQVFGVSLSFTDYLLVAFTATIVSIGAAGIPSASLFLLATVLQVIDLGAAETALVVGFILPFDRILDMARTTVNVTGDAAVSVTVARMEGELNEETFRAPPTY